MTGSPHFTHRSIIADALKEQWAKSGFLTVVHGGDLGAAEIAGSITYDQSRVRISEEVHPAQWRAQGRRAAYLRNERMVEAGADACLVFLVEGSADRIADHCAKLARAAGIEVKEFWQHR